MRRLAVVVTLVAFAVVTSACSPDDAPSSSTGPEPPTTEPSTPSPTPTDEVLEFVGEGTPLEPGRYRYSPFEPPLTFAVGEGWEGGHDHLEFFDVWNGDALTVGFGRPDRVFGGRGEVPADELSPRSALATMATGDVDAGEIGRTTLDARPAFEMRFTVERPTAVFGGPTGELSIDPGWDVRTIAVDVDGTLVLVFVQSQSAGTDGPADDVLSTVRFD